MLCLGVNKPNFNTNILIRSDIKFLDRHFLFIEKFNVFLDYIMSRAIILERPIVLWIII